jgi:hypothetical protein
MSTSPLVSPHGVPAHAQGGTPSPLPRGQSVDALETIEFGQVVPRFKGRADGKDINRIVREELQAS